MITCTFENGSAGKLRHVTVSMVAVNDQHQVLLTKRAPHLLRGGFYTVPGGFLDRDETTQACALRELEEETGYAGEIVSLLNINDTPHRPKEDRQNVDFIYVVRVTGGEKKINDEVTEIAWFDKEHLPSEEEFAFDHREAILLYFQYLETQFPLPVVGSIKG